MTADPAVTAILLDVVDVLGETVAAHVAHQHRENGTRGFMHSERYKAISRTMGVQEALGQPFTWLALMDLDVAGINATSDEELRDRLVRHVALTTAWIADLDRTRAAGR